MAPSLTDVDDNLELPPVASTVPALQRALMGRLADQGVGPDTARVEHWYWAVAKTLRDELLPVWERSKSNWNVYSEKQAHLISIEWLPGPHTYTALHSARLNDAMPKALTGLLPKGYRITPQDIYGYEPDPGLGNGGLGRLMSCFILSAAFRHYPVMGYGMCWEEGLFQQVIKNGQQVELPDNWKPNGNPWGVERHDRVYKVPYFGEYSPDHRFGSWNNPAQVTFLAHDTMVPSYDGEIARTLRLWQKDPKTSVETANAEQAGLVELISRRLYPSDRDNFGRNLRFMQEYALASASVGDILDCHLNRQKQTLDSLPKTKAIQLNDTHPVIAIPEMMRVLMDNYSVGWDRAKEITRGTFYYTNHTLAAEALEKWHDGVYRYILPRHVGIVEKLQNDLMQEAVVVTTGRSSQEREAFQNEVSILSGSGHDQYVRSGHMALAYTRTTNGVSDLHTELLRAMFPRHLELRGNDFIVSRPNGISPVSWWVEAHPKLAALITNKLGSEAWVGDLSLVDKGLETLQFDPDFRHEFSTIKREKKRELSTLIEHEGGPSFGPDTMVDVMAKRFHGYKRQFLNALGTVALYLDIKNDPEKDRPDVIKIFAGKAARDYDQAKAEIALINALAEIINNDDAIGKKLKLFFIPNYRVSMAKTLFPAADMPEHLSTAGWEAAGTSQAKPGGVEQLTRDGNNLKVIELVGEENCFVFGHTKNQLDALVAGGYNPIDFIESGRPHFRDNRLYEALVFIQRNTRFGHLTESVWQNDPWRIAADFVGNPNLGVVGYWESQEKARSDFRKDPEAWKTKEIRTHRALSHFSSNDTLDGYAKHIWGIAREELPVRPTPGLARPQRIPSH